MKVIACATVAEELRYMGFPEDDMKVLEFALHVEPSKLRERLQAEIESVEGDCDIVLGYGKCSNALEGIKSGNHRLIIPRVEDCIAIFLGSQDEYLRVQREEPGTYYLTKGWVIAQMNALEEYNRLVEKYGEYRAKRVVSVMFANYKRVVLINTGNYELDDSRLFASEMARFLGLSLEEKQGSRRLLEKMVRGEWDREFIVAERNSTVSFN